MTVTVDLPLEVAHSLSQKAAQEGQDIAGYLQQIAMREAQAAPQEPPALRTPGLHAGQYWIADDFDAPLPDSFWLGEAAKYRSIRYAASVISSPAKRPRSASSFT